MDILHKKGKDNVVVDSLSRKDEEVQVYAVSMVIPEFLDEIRTEYAKNAQVCSIIDNINQYSKFEWKNDLLWYKGQIYLSENYRFKTKVCKESHDFPTVGHVGFYKTYYNERKSFFWKGMNTDIDKYVAKCDTC